MDACGMIFLLQFLFFFKILLELIRGSILLANGNLVLLNFLPPHLWATNRYSFK